MSQINQNTIDFLLDPQGVDKVLDNRLATNEDSLTQPQMDALSQYGYKPVNFPGIYQPTSELSTDVREAAEKGILAGDPLITKDFVSRMSPQFLAQYSGVDFEAEATPGSAIEDFEFLPESVRNDPKAGPDAITKILQDNYREAGFTNPSFNWDVRVEPNTNEYIFNDPFSGKPRPVNPPGMNMGDFTAFMKPFAAEILPGLAAAGVTRSATVGIMTEALGSYVYRMKKLEELDNKGYLPQGFDKNSEAMKQAGLVAAFGGAGGLGYRLYKMYMGRGLGAIPIDEDEFMSAYENLRKEGTVDTKFLTTPQVLMGDDVPGAVNLEQFLRNEANRDTPFGRVLREKYSDQGELFSRIVDNLIETQGVTREQAEEAANLYTRQETGREIQETVAEDVARQTIPIDQKIADLDSTANEILTNLSNNRLPADEAGRQLRDSVVTLKNARYDKVDLDYETAYKQAGFKGNAKPFNYSSLNKTLDRIIKTQSESGLPNKQVLDIATSLKNTINTNKSFKQFQGDIRQLQSSINNIASKGGDFSDLISIRDGMDEIRNNALRNKNPEAFKTFSIAEDAYKQADAEFDSNVIKQITQMQKQGSDLYQLGDKEAYDRLLTVLRNNKDTSYLNKILDPENVEAFEAMRQGLRGDFFAKVVDDTAPDGLLRPKGGKEYDEWMSKNGKILKRFFDETELAEFISPTQFIRSFKNNQRNLESARTAIEQSDVLRNIVKTDSPEAIFSSSWSKDRVSVTDALRRVLQNKPELLEQYKRYIMNDMLKSVGDASRLVGGRSTISGKKLIQYADDYGAQLTGWFGEEFPRHLKGLGEELKSFDDINVASLSPADSTLFNIINQGARTYVGLFTTEGRMLTAVKMAKAYVERERFMNLLTNPDNLYETIKNARKLNTTDRSVLARAVGREVFTPEDDEPQSQDTRLEMMLEPGAQIATEEELELNRGGHVTKKLTIPLRYGYSN
tara:strand:- start:21100 stop:23994 length:2895 start_codon:yes stop_codon:yes gene_type:complete